MKKILILALLGLLGLSNVQAQMKNHALMHANPMPNLVRVAMKNADSLNITKEQKQEIKAWSEANKPKMKELIKLVMTEERMLRKEALTADKDVVAKAQTMLDARKEIIVVKTQCRQNLKRILNEKQYKDLVKLYRTLHKKK